MNKTAFPYIYKLLWTLIIIQVVWSSYLTGYYIWHDSNLRIFLDKNMPRDQKLALVLGGDYPHSVQAAKLLAPDAGILLITSNPIYFLNYYYLPKRIYTYPGLVNENDVTRIPKTWLREKRIDYVLLYHSLTLKLLKVTKDWNLEWQQ